MDKATLKGERVRIFFLFSLCLVCLFGGCQKNPGDNELVRVNDVSISLEEFREITNASPGREAEAAQGKGPEGFSGELSDHPGNPLPGGFEERL